MQQNKILKLLRQSRDRLITTDQQLKDVLSKCSMIERALSREIAIVERLESEVAGSVAVSVPA